MTPPRAAARAIHRGLRPGKGPVKNSRSRRGNSSGSPVLVFRGRAWTLSCGERPRRRQTRRRIKLGVRRLAGWSPPRIGRFVEREACRAQGTTALGLRERTN